MKRSENNTYNIQITNLHLLDILESNYYIELGNVDLTVLIKLLNGETVFFNDLMYLDILVNGLGKITDKVDLDIHFQFNYLYELHQKSSSSKFVLTCGTIKYIDKTGIERYSPLVLIPLTLNYAKKEFVLNSLPRLNVILFKYLKKEELLSTEQSNLLENLDGSKIHSVLDIDTICKTISEITKFSISTTNYLTTIDIEYPDYVEKKNIFNTQRSILEISDMDLLNQYYQKIKSVLTTNIEQKYILLKAHNGESFVVDGKMGTGKTRTALNIMADLIHKGKKVLYVNQDLDNINDLRKNLNYLGLLPYVYDLTKNVWDFDSEEELTVNSYNKFNFNVINELESYRHIYDEKYHDYPYSYILEKLAIRKAQGLTDSIIIEKNLDNEEVKKIYNSLKEIEEHLKHVDPLGESVWMVLLSGKNAPRVKEIIEHTHNFLDTTKKLVKILDKTATKYNLEKIETITDFNHLIEQLLSFTTVKPLLIWTEKGFYQKSLEALNDISAYSDNHFTCASYYKQYCSTTYKPGTMIEYFNNITGKYFNITDENSSDVKYIDEMFANRDHLISLTNQTKKWVDSSIDNYHHIKEYFNFGDPASEQFILLNKIHSAFSKVTIDNEWLREYIVNPRELIQKAKRLKKDYELYLNLQNDLSIYLSKDELAYLNLSQIINNKKFNSLIKKKINKTALKHAKTNASKVIADVKGYFEQCNLIKDEIPDKTSLNKLDDETWKNYLLYLDFISSLNEFENTHLIYFIKNIIHNKTFELKSFVELLGKLKENENELEIIEKAMSIYNFKVTGTNFIESVKSIRTYIPYFEQVNYSVDAILASFKDSKYVKTHNVLLTIDCDKNYLDCEEHFNKNHTYYKKLFGSAYKGVDSEVYSIQQSIVRFIDFMKRLKIKVGMTPKSIYEALLNDSVFKDLLSNITTFTELYNDWFAAIRDFSACFYGGRMSLQNDTFSEIIKTVSINVNKIHEVEHIYAIENILDDFYKYGLVNLSNGIRSGEYNEGIAEQYLYSTMFKYYNDMQKDGYKRFDMDLLKESAYNYKIEEERYCETNLSYLRKKSTNILFNKRTKKKKIVKGELENLTHNKYIYIADIDTFNSIYDLGFFDLVLIDDAHLSTANKYTNLQNASQVIVFGDKSFQTSNTSSLMQKVKKEVVVSLHKRYVEMKSEFNNPWQIDNQYIYSPKLNINIKPLKSIENMVKTVVDEYKKYKDTTDKRTINIVVFKQTTRRIVYSILINILKDEFSLEEILKITNYGIRIISANGESTRLCDVIYLWYDDIKDLDFADKEIARRNYILAKKDINICYGAKASEKQMLASIDEFIGKPHVIEHSIEGITKILYEKLINENINIELGPGYIDLIIKKPNKNIGIILYGKRTDNSYSIIDDYLYYVFEYRKRGWDIHLYCMEELFTNLDQVLNEIIKMAQ